MSLFICSNARNVTPTVTTIIGITISVLFNINEERRYYLSVLIIKEVIIVLKINGGLSSFDKHFMVFIIVFNVEKQLDLNDFALIGRTYKEYHHMFNLDDLSEKEIILDVASGVSSFCAEANKKGHCVTAADQIYNMNLKIISQKSEQDLNKVIEQMSHVNDLFVWDYYKNISSLKKHRIKSREIFLKDFEKYHTTRYVQIKFPETDFKINQFDISLVSHFLFLYEKILDYHFHKMTILELLRITSNQIRIFPIVNLMGKRSPMVDTIMKDDSFKNIHMSIKKVEFGFMKNGNEMLVIEK